MMLLFLATFHFLLSWKQLLLSFSYLSMIGCSFDWCCFCHSKAVGVRTFNQAFKNLANPIFVFIHNAITNITNFTLWKSICFNWIWTKACRMDDADKTIGLLAFAIYVVFYIFKWSHFGLCIDFMFDKTVVAISSSCLPTVYWLC